MNSGENMNAGIIEIDVHGMNPVSYTHLINSDYFSWKIIFEKKETDDRMCEHKFRYVYAMYICNEKITKAMVGKELEVCVYKFYADGCVYNLDDSFGSTIKCKVIMQTTQGYTYPILQIP